MDPVGAAATLPDRLDRMLFHEFAQITPGRGPTHFGEVDGFAQGHAARETLRFGIQQPIEQFLLAVVEAAVPVALPKSHLAPHRIDHHPVGEALREGRLGGRADAQLQLAARVLARGVRER